MLNKKKHFVFQLKMSWNGISGFESPKHGNKLIFIKHVLLKEHEVSHLSVYILILCQLYKKCIYIPPQRRWKRDRYTKCTCFKVSSVCIYVHILHTLEHGGVYRTTYIFCIYIHMPGSRVLKWDRCDLVLDPLKNKNDMFLSYNFIMVRIFFFIERPSVFIFLGIYNRACGVLCIRMMLL